MRWANLRQQFADVEARHPGVNGLELAANLDRGVRLEIDQVLVRRPAGQKDHDHGLVGVLDPGPRLGLQQLRQRQPAQGQAADLQKATPRQAIAETLFRAKDR